MYIYQYLLSRALFFLAAYTVVYGFQYIGILSALPLAFMVGIYLIAVILIFLSATVWADILRKAAKDKREEIAKGGLSWFFYNVGDWTCVALASQIFAFNGFYNFSNLMFYLLGLSVVYFMAILRVRYVVRQTLKND